MSKLTVFNFITLNGYFKGPNDDISWHTHGAEENEYAHNALKNNNTLIFGRITYQLMAGYWPTAFAIKNDPEMATAMNKADKVVFSRTLQKADWNNTRLVKDKMAEEIKKLKSADKDLTILGSGSIVTQLAEQKLIDEYQIMIDPVILGDCVPMFKNITRRLSPQLTDTRTFKSGVVLLSYKSNH